MPFVNLSDITNIIPEGLSSYFESNPAIFDNVENEAAKFVARMTGIAIPASASNAPEWASVHLANIITYLSFHKLTPVSPELVQTITAKYKESVAFLQTAVTRGTVTDITYSASGTFNTVNSW